MKRMALKQAVKDGKDPFQAGYDAGFQAGRVHGFRLGYEQAQRDRTDQVTAPLVQPVHGVLVGDKLLESPHA